MDVLLHRYFWVVRLVGLLVVAWFAASAITTQLGSQWLLTIDAEAASASPGDELDADEEAIDPNAGSFAMPGTPASVSPKEKQRTAEAIVEGNPFCPTCQPASAEEAQYDADGRPIGTVAGSGEVRSALRLKLMATMESDVPEFSLATVLDEDSGTAGVYGIDDVMRPGVVVLGIERGLVHIQNGQALEYLSMGDEPVKPPAAVAAAEPPEDTAPNDRAIPGATDAINCPSENLCIVERKFVEQLVTNPAMLARQARVIPAVKDGETRGFKFYGIRRDSLPRLLGIKNGDLLLSINGEELTSVDRVWSMYSKLRHANNLQVSIERKGQTINKEIQIK